jgi:hypothetical protein
MNIVLYYKKKYFYKYLLIPIFEQIQEHYKSTTISFMLIDVDDYCLNDPNYTTLIIYCNDNKFEYNDTIDKNLMIKFINDKIKYLYITEIMTMYLILQRSYKELLLPKPLIKLIISFIGSI